MTENVKGLTVYMMAGRIHNREDNVYYKRDMISDILKMYMDECHKALLNGERIQIAGVGTIIPEVKVCESFNMPNCNKEGGNPPYTTLRLSRTQALTDEMNKKIIDNVDNGILGLEKKLLTRTQIKTLKKIGYLPEDTPEPEE